VIRYIAIITIITVFLEHGTGIFVKRQSKVLTLALITSLLVHRLFKVFLMRHIAVQLLI